MVQFLPACPLGAPNYLLHDCIIINNISDPSIFPTVFICGHVMHQRRNLERWKWLEMQTRSVFEEGAVVTFVNHQDLNMEVEIIWIDVSEALKVKEKKYE